MGPDRQAATGEQQTTEHPTTELRFYLYQNKTVILTKPRSSYQPHKRSPNAIEGGMKEVDHQNSSSEVAAHAKNLSETVQSFIYVMLFNHAYRRHVANWLCNTAEFQKIYCIFLPLDGYDASLDFASRTFNNLMLVRAHLILSLAKSSIEMVLIESDAIWFRDPYPLFARHFTFNTADTVTPLKGGQEQAELREMSPLVIRPTDRFVRFWKGLTKKLENLTDVDDQV
ncbi:hypothetical protein ANCCEY_07494 [Ancylostoma ceylanicum]|uniref:Nucleotide-diphospho-sugar transferase domain-containing protein n=1 Tax=Ancylostoma ceylanicum TaxID=53326 RepID=A0A0D6LQE5_9BILA|nr:hypothetical protein ANCCEY_07494 [Ancylostoma ceylanicum]